MTLEEGAFVSEVFLNSRLIFKRIQENILIICHNQDDVWLLSILI